MKSIAKESSFEFFKDFIEQAGLDDQLEICKCMLIAYALLSGIKLTSDELDRLRMSSSENSQNKHADNDDKNNNSSPSKYISSNRYTLDD